MTTIDISSAWYEVMWMFKYVWNFIWITFDGVDDGITLYDLYCAGFVLVTLISAFLYIFNSFHNDDVEGD